MRATIGTSAAVAADVVTGGVCATLLAPWAGAPHGDAVILRLLAAVHLLVAAKASARLWGRHFVIPDDVIRVAPGVLRHRLVLRPEAELDRLTPDAAVANAIAAVPVPR